MTNSRIETAKLAAFATRGPRKGHLKATCPPMGSDGAIFWQAAMMRCNPYKVSIAAHLFMTSEQREFYTQCEAWVNAQHNTWAIGADKDRAHLTAMGVY
jgi:hypothetical protein